MPCAPVAMNGLRILSFRISTDAGCGLIGIVAADHALPGLRVVGLADSRQQHQPHIEQRESADQHDIGGLLPFLARRIDIGDAGGALAGRIQIDLGHFGFGLRAEIGKAQQCRQHAGLRARLGIIAAAEALAESAIGALAELDAERIGIGLAQIRRGLRKRPVAGLARGFGKQGRAKPLLQRRRRIFRRAPALERIAAGLLGPADIAGLAGRAAEFFETVVIGLESRRS